MKAEKAETVPTATAKIRRLPLRMAKAATMPWKTLSCQIDIRHTHPRLTILERGLGKDGGDGMLVSARKI